jgi:transcriptional regulator with XRE-family HTH domain
MPTTEDISTRLRAARKQHGLSQRRLARQSGVSNATISLIEKGDLNPTVSTLFKILSAFPMSITEFWESDHPNTNDMKRAWTVVRSESIWTTKLRVSSSKDAWN